MAEEHDEVLFEELKDEGPTDELVPVRVVLRRSWLAEALKRKNCSAIEKECLVAAEMLAAGTE